MWKSLEKHLQMEGLWMVLSCFDGKSPKQMGIKHIKLEKIIKVLLMIFQSMPWSWFPGCVYFLILLLMVIISAIAGGYTTWRPVPYPMGRCGSHVRFFGAGQQFDVVGRQENPLTVTCSNYRIAPLTHPKYCTMEDHGSWLLTQYTSINW